MFFLLMTGSCWLCQMYACIAAYNQQCSMSNIFLVTWPTLFMYDFVFVHNKLSTMYVHTFFSLAAICRFLFTWLLAMLANFLATVLGRLMGIECLSTPSTGGTISIAVMHSSPACFVTIFILDHLEDGLILGTAGLLVDVATGFGFVATCNKSKKTTFTTCRSCWKARSRLFHETQSQCSSIWIATSLNIWSQHLIGCLYYTNSRTLCMVCTSTYMSLLWHETSLCFPCFFAMSTCFSHQINIVITMLVEQCTMFFL